MQDGKGNSLLELQLRNTVFCVSPTVSPNHVGFFCLVTLPFNLQVQILKLRVKIS